MLFEFFERIYAAEENGGNLRRKFSQRIHLCDCAAKHLYMAVFLFTTRYHFFTLKLLS